MNKNIKLMLIILVLLIIIMQLLAVERIMKSPGVETRGFYEKNVGCKLADKSGVDDDDESSTWAFNSWDLSAKDLTVRAVFPDVEKIYQDTCPDRKPQNFNDYKIQQDYFKAPENIDKLVASRAEYSSFLDKMIEEKQCKDQLTVNEFVCKAQCQIDEPELEYSIRRMRISSHSDSDIIFMCKKKYYHFLFWISDDGTIKHYNCFGEHGILGPNPWSETKILFYLVSCLVKFPKDIVFGFDTQDYAMPTYHSPFDMFHYMKPLPGILRYVGTPAHDSILFPTGSHIVATAHCKIRSKSRWWRICGSNDDKRYSQLWSQRNNTIMWRGTATGDDWSKLWWRHNQRAQLVREYGITNPKGFDVGFTRDIKTPQDEQHGIAMKKEWKHVPDISKGDHPNYKYLLHVDGNTASWGISHKLNSGSVILWIESRHNYREYFYHLMKKWVHYIPVAVDLSNLDVIHQITKNKDEELSKIAQNALHLIDTRIRAQDIHCYIVRILKSIKVNQVKSKGAGDEAKLSLFKDILGNDSILKFETLMIPPQ